MNGSYVIGGAQMVSASTVAQNVPEVSGSIPASLANLASNVRDLNAAVEQLNMRLEAAGVLRPAPPQSTGNGGIQPVEACPLAEAIRDQSARIFALDARVRDLMGRFEG